MTVSSIISAIGNNAKLTPIIVKDNIENTSRVILANKQGSKVSKEVGFYEAREAAVEEFGTSALWFAAPVAVGALFNSAAKKLLKLDNKEVLNADTKLFNGQHYQTFEKNIQHAGDNFIKQADVDKVAKKISKLKLGKGALETAVTVGLIYGLTMFKQKMTKNSIDKKGKPQGLTFKGAQNLMFKKKASAFPAFSSFVDIANKKAGNGPAFKGIATQAAIDGVVGGIRVGTARDKKESKEYAFKTVSFVALCYGSGPIIEKGMNFLAKKLNMPIEIDAKLLGDSKFAEDVTEAAGDASKKKNLLHFPKISEGETDFAKEKKIVDFIDNQLKTGINKTEDGKFESFQNKTLEIARKSGLIDVNADGKRAVGKFIDTKAVHDTNKHLNSLVDAVASKGSKGMKSMMKTIKATKYGSVIANVAISTFLTAYTLPKIQYMFREKSIGAVASPGVKATARDLAS